MNYALAPLMVMGPFGKLVRRGGDEAAGVASNIVRKNSDDVVEGAVDAPVPTIPSGGSNPNDFVNPHSEKHMYDPSRTSTPNRSQYGKDVDVGELRQETMNNPDRAYTNWPNLNNPNSQRITKYYKEFDGYISTPDTPTGSNRVFDNLYDPLVFDGDIALSIYD